MKHLAILTLILAFIMTACGGQDSADVTSAPGPDTAVPSEVDTAVPSDVDTPESSAPAASTDGGVTITGDFEATLSNRGQIVLTSGVINDTPYYELAFIEGMDILVNISLPGDVTPGTYDLTTDTETAMGGFGADVSAAREAGNLAAGAIDYNDTIAGTITLDEIGSESGSAVSGNFEFTATGTFDDENGVATTQTITVSGTFSGLTLLVESS